MTSFWETVLLGVIEGVTEFLPISSTAHLLLAQQLFGMARSEAFTVIIQLGAIMAVVLIYWRKLLTLITGLHDPEARDYLIKLGGSFGLTLVGVLAAKKAGWELPDRPEPIIAALVIGAFVIVWAEWRLKSSAESDTITWPIALAAGLGQIVAAIFPGASRSGATIMATMLLGHSRKAATEFSFLLGIPTMFAASAYSAKKAYEAGEFHAEGLMDLAIGFFVSMAVAFLVVKWLIQFVRSNTFLPFAWYRLALGLGLLAFLMWGQ